MDLGTRLRQARQEAGLSQRQLCGEQITRNMLSQIENGSARPSMETLQYFARQLGKPIGYFLEEELPLPPNQQLMQQMRKAPPQQVLELLKDYCEPDEQLDAERFFIEALACLALAQTAIEQGKNLYAANLLEQAQQAGSKTPYYTEDNERRRLLLCHRANAIIETELARRLPPLDEELLLRAEAALSQGDSHRCIALLQAAEKQNGYWHFLMAKALMQQQHFALAAEHLRSAETYDPRQVYTLLERCCSALEDYKQAYYYACKLRDLEKGNTSFFSPQDV